MTPTDLASLIDEQTTLDGVWSALLDGLRPMGVEFVIYLTVGGQFDAPFALTNIPEIYEGQAQPTAESLAADPFLHWCCDSYELMLTGADIAPGYDYLPPEALAFIERAGRTGFRTGIAFPMRLTGSDRFGGFNLGTRLSEAALRADLLPQAESLRFVCLVAHRRIEELSEHPRDDGEISQFRPRLVAPTYGPVLDDLTPREREVLFLIARGLSRKEAARACQISVHTVSEYIKSAYRKLDIRNKAEAARLITSLETQGALNPDNTQVAS